MSCRYSISGGSPQARHIKASQPHFPRFPRFRVRIFRIFHVFSLDGLAIRNANRRDSRESIRTNQIRRKIPVFMTCERFARIASNLRFGIFSPLKRAICKKGFSSGIRKRFARIGPSKVFSDPCLNFSGVRGAFHIVRIFPVSGLDR